MKRSLILLALLFVAGQAAFAQETQATDEEKAANEQKATQERRVSDERKTTIALSGGMFFPISSSVRDEYDGSWSRISLKTFEPTKPMSWRFIAEGGSYRLAGSTDASLYPLTFGMERALSEGSRFQPYVSLRGGPYYGKVTRNLTGDSEEKIGLNLNAAYGVTIKKRYYAEIRYDYFTEIAGLDLQGLSISAGIRLFDIRL